MSGSKTRYIPALDGLRAFAVLAVIAYHFGFDWAKGGLLGVTVFFVLSGYLITSLLLAEWRRTHTIDLKSFWLRRVKRLFPAIVFLIICVVALCALFNHDLLTKMRPDVPPALFFYSNWWYIFREVSYFETLGAPSPLTHFWSLAIEEQFYLVWPVLLFILFKRGTKKKIVTRITLALAIVSVFLMAIIYDPGNDPSRVYYGTDTRAFSLLIGALLAFIWPSNQLDKASDLNLSPGMRIAFDGIGIAAFIGLLIMTITADGFSPFMYRGGILLASLLTAVVIAVLVHPKSLFAQAASLPPLTWIGKRSYGMYLWHYPIMLLMTPVNSTGEQNIFYILLQLLIMFAASAFSYRFVEDPIRKGAIGRFVTSVRSGEIQPLEYLKSHLLPVAFSAALVLGAILSFIFIPPTSSVANIDALKDAPEQSHKPAGVEALAEAEESFSYNILMIGDSVSVRAIPYFEQTFPEGAIDSAVSRPLSEGVNIYNYYKNLEVVGDIVVFSLGTNGPAADEQIDELLNAVGPEKTVYFINTRSPQSWVQTTNDTLWRAADRYDNVKVIDWFSQSAGHDDYFDGDGTHLTEEGAQIYTEMIRLATGLPVPPPPSPENEAVVDYRITISEDLNNRVNTTARELLKTFMSAQGFSQS